MEKICATIIIEMMGKPAGHLKETLEKYVDMVGIEKGVKILNTKINKPKPVPDSKLLSDFAEIELELESLQHLINLIFTYMPSHIEITSPEEVMFKNFELNNLCNDLTRRLLEYDSIAKKMILEKKVLENQLMMKGMKPAIEEKEKANIKKIRKKPKKQDNFQLQNNLK